MNQQSIRLIPGAMLLVQPSMENLSKTLEVVSTSKEKVLKPFWTDVCQEISSVLWLPTKTVLQGLGLNLSNMLSNTMGDRSWFSVMTQQVPNMSWSKTLSQLPQFSLPGFTASKSTLTRSRKIRLILAEDQIDTIEWWFGVSRYVYNMTIEYLDLLDSDDKSISYYDLRAAIMALLPKWTKKCPNSIRASAIKDAYQAVKMARIKGKKSGKYQRTKFRSKRRPTQSVGITSQAYSGKGLFARILGENKFAEKLPDKMTDGRIVREHGIYYVITCIEVEQVASENQTGIVALDPGVRTFMTLFSHDLVGKLGDEANKVIHNLCLRLDALISEIALETNGKRHKRLLKVKDRIQKRIKNLTRELHYKVARFLCSRFEYILLPSFETSEMVKKDRLGKRRVIRSKTARQMNTLSFYQFGLRLKNIAEKMSIQVIDVTEEYTSKTVSWTGEIINGLGGANIIKSKDGQAMDRDYNGARNIYIKFISEHLV